MLKYFSFLIAIISLILFSCEQQDDYNKLVIEQHYLASFSLPIGDTSMSIERNGVNLPPDWQIDTVLEKLDSIRLQQQMPFAFLNSITNINDIQNLVIRVVVTNEFPAEANIVFYFADSFLNVVDSIPGSRFISAANVDSTGKVITPGYTIQDIDVIKDHFNKWAGVQNILINGYIKNTFKYRKLYKYYKNFKLNVEMGFRVDFDHTFYKKVF
jgi:hypothetical protein